MIDTRIIGIDIYERTVVVVRSGDNGNHEHEHIRGNIERLSNSSLKRLAFVVINTGVEFKSMITLTEPSSYTNNGYGFKRRLHYLLSWYRKNYGQSYLWWLEFQKRGAPHIHMLSCVDMKHLGNIVKKKSVKTLVGLVRPGYSQPVRVSYWRTHNSTWKLLEERWQSLGGGMTRWEIIEYEGGAKSYVLKYVTKTNQREVPVNYQDVGRFWGHSRDVKPVSKLSYRCSEEMLRESLKDWDYLTEDFLYRELYQCSDKIDVSELEQIVCKNCGTIQSHIGNCVDCGNKS